MRYHGFSRIMGEISDVLLLKTTRGDIAPGGHWASPRGTRFRFSPNAGAKSLDPSCGILEVVRCIVKGQTVGAESAGASAHITCSICSQTRTSPMRGRRQRQRVPSGATPRAEG